MDETVFRGTGIHPSIVYQEVPRNRSRRSIGNPRTPGPTTPSVRQSSSLRDRHRLEDAHKALFEGMGNRFLETHPELPTGQPTDG